MLSSRLIFRVRGSRHSSSSDMSNLPRCLNLRWASSVLSSPSILFKSYSAIAYDNKSNNHTNISKRLLTSASRTHYVEQDKAKTNETAADTTIEKRQQKIEEERIKREINLALASQSGSSSSLVHSLPSPIAPYFQLMRMDKPKPILLLYWPGAWGILGAASYLHLTSPDLFLLGLFLAGATFTRSAGCIINDIWDRKLDAQVERTANRPLASGRIGLPAAFALLGVNLAVCLSCLVQLNLPTQMLGACALFPIAMYPTAKRFTNWPQVVLGSTFGWGALMGWSSVVFSSSSPLVHHNILDFMPGVFVYAASVAWITMYDTIYGFQDIQCDRQTGIKSTSIHLERRIKSWLAGFSSLTVGNLAAYGWLTNQEPIFYICLGAASLHFLKQIVFFDPKSPRSALKYFYSNNTVGALVAFGLLASILIK